MNLVKRKWCILLFSALLSISAMGSELGLNYDSTFSLANQGDADAQNSLESMYYEGKGVSQDYQKNLSGMQKPLTKEMLELKTTLDLCTMKAKACLRIIIKRLSGI